MMDTRDNDQHATNQNRSRNTNNKWNTKHLKGRGELDNQLLSHSSLPQQQLHQKHNSFNSNQYSNISLDTNRINTNRVQSQSVNIHQSQPSHPTGIAHSLNNHEVPQHNRLDLSFSQDQRISNNPTINSSVVTNVSFKGKGYTNHIKVIGIRQSGQSFSNMANKNNNITGNQFGSTSPITTRRDKNNAKSPQTSTANINLKSSSTGQLCHNRQAALKEARTNKGRKRSSDTSPSNDNKIKKRVQKGRKTLNIPGFERDKFLKNVGEIWKLIFPLWNRIQLCVSNLDCDDFAKINVNNLVEDRKKQSEATRISSIVNDKGASFSTLRLLKFIETELTLLYNLVNSLMQLMKKITKKISNSDNFLLVNKELLILQSDINTRINETSKLNERMKGMLQNANIEQRPPNVAVKAGTSSSQNGNIIKKSKPNINNSKARKRERNENNNKKLARKTFDSNSSNTKEAEQREKKNNRPVVKIKDEQPDRVTNPLLEMPYCQIIPGSEASLMGSECWKTIPLYFPIPDTFPLAYTAKLLGFNASQIDNKYIETPIESIDYQSILLNSRKQDEWKSSPIQNHFSQHIDYLRSINNAQEDMEVDEVDPMWSAILEQSRGIRYDLNRPSTDVKKGNVISHDCISFALRLKIFSDDMNYRLAIMKDVASLKKLVASDDYGSDENAENFFSNAIKCGSHFIIVAESKDMGIVGYIHYRFCWFKQEVERSSAIDSAIDLVDFKASPLKIMSERILHIENVQSNESHICDSKKNISLVLMSLVLEHARRYAVYGIMEVAASASKNFTNYFRMKVISKECSRTFLAIDLEYSSYQYAFLRKEKEICDTGNCNNREVLRKNERMLVILPTVKEYSQVLAKMTDLPLVVESNDIQHVVHNNPNTSSSASMLLKFDKSSRKFLAASNYNIENIPSDDAPQIDTDDNLKSLNWTVLRTFPKRRHGTEKTESISNQGTENCSSISKELEQLQHKLDKTEEEVMPSLWQLYKKSFDDRKKYEFDSKTRTRIQSVLTSYDKILQLRQDEQLALERMQEQEENAVCDICYDGESTGENRIIFCDSCNISVHQQCYGIDKVPVDDYYCHTCVKFNDKKIEQKSLTQHNNIHTKIEQKIPPQIVCEVCPRRQGAFIQTNIKNSKEPKWVHVVCAKWHGFRFVDPNTDEILLNGAVVEDVTDLKMHFMSKDLKCCLCDGMRGCYMKCSDENCNKFMHVTCARSSGQCNVNHGGNHLGLIESDDAWSLKCPSHSTLESDVTSAGTAHLKILAKAFPVEPKPVPPPKPFYKMTKRERDQNFAEPAFESELMRTLMIKLNSSRCEICHLPNHQDIGIVTDRNDDGLMQCTSCSATAHTWCLPQKWKIDKAHKTNLMSITCTKCLFEQAKLSSEDFEIPECHMCNQKEGTLIKAIANPVSNKLKKWKAKEAQFRKTYFGRQIWCHPVCGMWHSKCTTDLNNGVVDCSNVIMAGGKSHVDSRSSCNLCGRNDKVKIQCCHDNPNIKHNSCPFRFHATCARQAGFQVADEDNNLIVKCFEHSSCQYALRAVLEDMMEIENQKQHNGFMSLDRAATIFNWGVVVLRCLGWAWRWTEWWVQLGDTWEPLLEAGQNEKNMTEEELRIVQSSALSRKEDAKKCRLAAFGAALRNRDYDKEEGDDRVSLERALCAVFSIPSLVGPLKTSEIEFYVQWLARIYRSKSPLLGFGAQQIPVNDTYYEGSHIFFLDKTPKFELGSRSLPGKQVLKRGQIFETGTNENDDFDVEEIPLSILLRSPERMHIGQSSYNQERKARRKI